MSDILRLLADDGLREPRQNLALDEAIARESGPGPVLRLWRNDPCVVLGRFQVADAEVDVRATRALGVPVYRRFTGGGAVYHDPGNLNVSLVVPRTDLDGHGGRGLQAIYGAVLGPLAAAIRRLGVPAVPARRGLFVGTRKLGGIAAWVGADRALIHATLLVDADLATLDRVLAGPGDPGNDRWRRTRSEPAPVTSIARELGRTVAGPALHALIDDAVARAFGAPTDPRGARSMEGDGLTPAELAAAAALFMRRYTDPAWHTSGA